MAGASDSVGAVFADDVKKEPVDAAIFGELGVKGCREQATGANEDSVRVPMSKELNAGPDAADAWRPDEDHLHGPTGQASFAVEDDRVILAAVGVSLDVDVEHTEAALGWMIDLLCEKDAPGTGAEDRLGPDELVEDRIEAGTFEVLEECGGLSSREDKGIERCEFLGFTHEVR